MTGPTEAGFETAISESLITAGGYRGPAKVGTQSGAPDLDLATGIDTAELFAFIGATQAEEWDKVRRSHSTADEAQRAFVARLAKELDRRGTIAVLRHGITYAGHERAEISLAYFRPASGLNPVLAERYAANRLTVTRQVPYEAGSTKTVDLAMFVNGIPVATAELKTPLTGQTFRDAIEQYRTRHAKAPLLRRAVVHFALDTEQVFMTTRLRGEHTAFLPFNRGHDQGAGNPPRDGYRTGYLWTDVLAGDAWLDLLARFVHTTATDGGPVTIFPRFHQWDAVLRLEADAGSAGPGQSYLVQHSAGSGKSNTIAWLAHRLSSLHDAGDHKVFDKVVVITDRVVLDRQLQDTIYQLEHAHGVVEKIDEDSAQLAAALAGERARIVITTLQKFPFVMGHVEGALAHRRYAVIIDEAHSSQTGDAAVEMKKVLGSGPATPSTSCRRRRRPRSASSTRCPTPSKTPSSPRSRPGATSPTCRSSPSRPRRRVAPSSCSAAATRPPRSTSRSTSTPCARPSRRGSSTTCWPTTSPTRRTSRSTRPSPTTRTWTQPGPGPPSPGSCRCTRPTWPNGPRWSSSTSAST